MGKEKGPKYFKDDTQEETIRQVKIQSEDYSFSTLFKFAALQFTSPRERKCILIMATRRIILTPEYIKDVMSLPLEYKMNHILETAVEMRRASSIFIIYKAPGSGA